MTNSQIPRSIGPMPKLRGHEPPQTPSTFAAVIEPRAAWAAVTVDCVDPRRASDF